MTTTTVPADSTLSITVESNLSASWLSELNISSWPKWGCAPGKYKLKFEATETCYLVRGRVKVYPKRGSSTSTSSSDHDHEFVELGAGDLVTIPKGLSCIWDISVPIDKYYKFESSSTSSS